MIKVQTLDEAKIELSIPDEVIEFLKSADENVATGKHEFTNNCFVNVILTNTKEPNEESLMEAHEKYIDIQYLIFGEEKILYTDKANLAVAKEYDSEGDYAMYSFDKYNEVTYKKGDAVVLDTSVAHLPGCALNGAMEIKKAVIKLKK